MPSKQETLADKGLTEVLCHVSVFFTPEEGFTCYLNESREEAIFNRGYGDLAGNAVVQCVVPVEMLKEFYTKKSPRGN